MCPFLTELRSCWFLAGPTAVGKSEAALILAEKLDAEIIAMDSMTLYRGMDIGTAKPSAEDQRRIRHHLLDVIEPHQEFSLAQYLAAAESAILSIRSRGKTPLFVGGTGLYLRGLLRGLFEGPPADWELRKRLEDREASCGPGTLHRDLLSVDPGTAARLHPNDVRRIIRAIEVCQLTGIPLSEHHQQLARNPDQRPENVFWLEPDRDWLYERINRRVDLMFHLGLVDEVRNLVQRPDGLGRTASQALGYKETLAYLNQGISLADTIIEIKTRTRQFAKRQHTWFRNLEECRAVRITSDSTALQIALELIAVSRTAN